MAHSAATGSAKRTVDVIGKRLGIKKFGGEAVNPGEIIVRQRGSEFYPGLNVKEGRDFTIYATIKGFVQFRRMTGYKRNQKYVDVVEAVAEVKAPVKNEAKAEVSTKRAKTPKAKAAR